MAEDPIGKQTLDVISQAAAFNKWMYETIKPYAKGKVLEIGSGIGNISTLFLNDGFEIQLSDLRPKYCKILQNKFQPLSNFLGAIEIDLMHPDFDTIYANYLESFETVFALNVVEHIQNDSKAIANCKKLLKRGGNLIILVPAYKSLYNQFDENLGHYRRYDLKSLGKLFHQNNLKIIHKQYFNFMGILGWYFSGRILKKESIPLGQMKLYNSLVPVFKIIDKVVFTKIGLSVIVVGEK